MDFIRLSFNEGRHHISFPASLYFKTSNDAKSIFAAVILRQCSNASSKFAILSQCICLAALRMHGCLSGCAGTFKGTDWPSSHPWPYSWSPIIGAYRIKCWAHKCSATWTKELCRNFSCLRTGKSIFNNNLLYSLYYRLSGPYSWSLTMHYDGSIVLTQSSASRGGENVFAKNGKSSK